MKSLETSFKQNVLKNGFTVINILVPNLPFSTSSIWVNAGSRFDSKNKAGLSHFFEHLLFTKTIKYPNREKRLIEVEKHGMLYNAFTSLQNQHYYYIHPTSQSEIALELLIDGLISSQFHTSDIEREKSIILNEEKENRTDPTSYIHRLANQGLWENHPLGHDIFGGESSIASINQDDLETFYQKEFTSDNITFVFINSKLTTEQQEQKIENIALRQKKSVTAQATPSSLKNIWEERETDNSQVAISFAFPNPTTWNERIAIDFLRDYLASGWTSRLIQRLRIENNFTYWINAESVVFSDYGSLRFVFSCQDENIQKCFSIIHEELQQILQHGVTSIDSHRVKFISDIERNSIDYSWLMYWFGWEASMHRPLITPQDYCEVAEQLSNETLIKTAQKYLIPEKSSIARIGKKLQKELFLFPNGN